MTGFLVNYDCYLEMFQLEVYRSWSSVTAGSGISPDSRSGSQREAVSTRPESVKSESRSVFKSSRSEESRPEIKDLIDSRGVMTVGSLVVVMLATLTVEGTGENVDVGQTQ